MKTAGKIAIATGVLLAAGGIAYAYSPAFRKVLSPGSSTLTPHQQVQVAINKIISNKSFFSTEFFDMCYNDGDVGAQKWVFDLANKTVKVPGEAYDNFNYEGLALINEYYRAHWHMQYQITRIMQSDDYAGYRAQLRGHYRDAAGNGHQVSTAEILKGIWENAMDDTGIGQLAGDFNEYYYHPVDAVDPLAGVSDVSFDQPNTNQWFVNYFNGGHGYTASHGGGAGNVGHGGTSGGGSSGGSGGGINVDGNAVIGWVQDAWCKVFPDLCATPDPTDCGYCSLYDEPTDSCIPDPMCMENDPSYDPCAGMGVWNEATGQCEMPSQDPCEGMGIYNEATGMCESPDQYYCQGMGVWNEQTQMCEAG